MSRSHSFASGEFYHLYNRGIEKRLIFLDKSDYERFIKILFFCNSNKRVIIRDLPIGLTFGEQLIKRGETIVNIGVYCLMPNHFHLLVKEKIERGTSLFMQKLLTSYAMYFNEKYGRKGRLFESSYKSVHAMEDEYLKYLFSYIHLNPIKLIDPEWKDDGIKDANLAKNYLSHYVFSSFADYAGEKRDYGLILNVAEFPEYFPDSKTFTSTIFDWFEPDFNGT